MTYCALKFAHKRLCLPLQPQSHNFYGVCKRRLRIAVLSCMLHNCRHRVPLFSEHRLLAFCSSPRKCSTRARALKMSSRSWKATRNSALADHETDRVLRSQICLMEKQILQLEELNERVSTIQVVVAQLDGKSWSTVRTYMHCSHYKF